MRKKNVLITGANKSIGYETAREMGLLGYRVWLGSRDEILGTLSVSRLVTDGIDARLVILDVRDIESVRAAAERVFKEDGKLDVLINNAGISGAQPIAPSEQDVSDILSVYQTNVFGPIRMTQAFLPLLKSAQKASVLWSAAGWGR